MLIKFSISNIYSFNQEVEFSMVAGKSRLLSNHIVDNGLSVLKSGVIYGANASGKSNFVKAINFAKKFIINGTGPDDSIPVKYFKLNKENIKKPSKFEFTFKVDKEIYTYGFTLNSNFVEEEWLLLIGKTVEKTVFTRKTISKQDSEFDFNYSLMKISANKEKQFLDFIGKGTRPNQLFLTESAMRNVSHFINIYNWFKNNLVIIFPESKFQHIEMFMNSDKELKKLFSKFLKVFDTGIKDIALQELDVDKELNIPKEIKMDLFNNLKSKGAKGAVGAYLIADNNERYAIFKNEENELKALKLTTVHSVKSDDKALFDLYDNQETVFFDLNEESDGTQRLLDLIPSLIDLKQQNKTFVIDEIDRSLHSGLTYKFFELFFEYTKNNNSQLITTTHETNLIDFDLLRRDEIWFIEKNVSGESQIYSLEEFKPRYDKDVRKGYLLGRFGAIPNIRGIKNLKDLKNR